MGRNERMPSWLYSSAAPLDSLIGGENKTRGTSKGVCLQGLPTCRLLISSVFLPTFSFSRNPTLRPGAYALRRCSRKEIEAVCRGLYVRKRMFSPSSGSKWKWAVNLSGEEDDQRTRARPSRQDSGGGMKRVAETVSGSRAEAARAAPSSRCWFRVRSASAQNTLSKI